jgi:CHAT domain-containing protein/tetratricopeptide (TPR) repeat protein
VTDPNFLFARAVELQQADRNAEAISVYRDVLGLAPGFASAWWNLAMLLDRAGDRDGSTDAYAAYIATADPDDAALLNFARAKLIAAGRTPPMPRQPTAPRRTVSVVVERNGVRRLVQLENDSGIDPDTVLATLKSFTDAVDWLDAYLVLRDHPELTSTLALTLLRLQTDLDTYEGQVAEENLRVLARSREAGADVAFAEVEKLDVADFRLLVRGVDQIQPVLRHFESTQDGDLTDALRAHPEIVQDEATDVLLWYLRKRQSDSSRPAVEALRTELERYRQGPPHPDAIAFREKLYREIAEDGAVDDLILDGTAQLTQASPEAIPDIALDLAIALQQRYERSEVPDDLRLAISILRHAVSNLPPGARTLALILSNLGSMLVRSFELDAQPADLDEAVDRLAAARRIVGDFSVLSPAIHTNLGSALYRRAELTGSAEAREASIAMLERAANSEPLASVAWLRRRLNLATPLFLRAEDGDQDAIDLVRRIADELLACLEPDDALVRNALMVAARANRLAFDWSGDQSDLERALTDYGRVLSLSNLTPFAAALAHSNFGNALRTHYEATGRLASLDEAIEHLTAALGRLETRPAEAFRQRANLAKALVRRYEVTGDDTDARAAVQLHRDVLATGRLAHHSLRAESALNLGSILLRLGADQNDTRIADEGMTLLWQTLDALDPVQNPVLVLEASTAVGPSCIRLGRNDLAAEALLKGMRALQESDRLTAGSPARYRLLRRGAEVVQLFAFALARLGRWTEAAVTLERGRARAVAEALQLDSAALDELAAAGRPDLTTRWAATTRDMRVYGSRLAGDRPDAVVARIRELHLQLDAIRREVRAVDGFADFGQPVDVETIHAAAAQGAALVYGCVTEFGAVFLIAVGDGRTEAIDVPHLDTATVQSTVTAYLAALEGFRSEPYSASAEERWIDALDAVTTWLGDTFATSLCTRLAELGRTSATLLLPGLLNAVPFAAARLASSGCCLDAIGVRYAPSALALVAAAAVAATSETRSAVIVGDPDGTADSLAAATAEVAGAAAAFARATVLTGGRASREAVLRELPNHDVAHFACHGLGYPANPLDSFVLLADDQRLTLRDILRLRVWRMRLCVLSACDTATVGTQAPDEYLSLPTGLLLAGTAGVIATQWPVWDLTAAIFSIRFYMEWSQPRSDPAAAFHRAQLWLRDATRRDTERLVTRRVAPEARGQLLDQLAVLPPEARPFRAVQDWAAFNYIGC